MTKGFFLSLHSVTNNFGNKIAEVAQLVERQPSKLNVAGSTPVFRSKESPRKSGLTSEKCRVEFSQPLSGISLNCLHSSVGQST
jgi:hypothetical protein